jgi:lipid A 3-O-deacylase
VLLVTNSTWADSNPMFGGYKNQISVSGGQSLRVGVKSEKLFYADITYSQPTTFFRLPARRNLELAGLRGDDCNRLICNEDNGYPKTDNLSQYNLTLLGLSQDVVFLQRGKFYANARLGVYLKDIATNRISSRFTFGQRLALGYGLGRVNLELYVRHFSNGSLTEQNSGQNFYGLTFRLCM